MKFQVSGGFGDSTNLDEETIRLLADANFRFILIGLESGSNFSLDKLKKGYTRETVVKTLKIMKKYFSSINWVRNQTKKNKCQYSQNLKYLTKDQF